MNNKFDELTKAMAQSVTRRAALKKFGLGLFSGLAASLWISKSSAAPRYSGYCQVTFDGFTLSGHYTGQCVAPSTCQAVTNAYCSSLADYGSRDSKRMITDACFYGLGFDPHQKCSF